MKNLDYGKLLSDYGNVLVLLVLCAVRELRHYGGAIAPQ